MSGRTHALVPAALAAVLFHADPLLLLTAALGGLTPDIDEPDSVIGQRFWVVSWWMKYVFGHRTVSHSLVMVLALLVIGLLLLIPTPLVLAFCLGWATHLVLDGLSGGILFWWPSKQRWILGRHAVFGPLDRVLMVTGLLICVVCLMDRVRTEVTDPDMIGTVRGAEGTKSIL